MLQTDPTLHSWPHGPQKHKDWGASTGAQDQQGGDPSQRLNINLSPEGKVEAVMHFRMCEAKNTETALILRRTGTQQ